MNKTFLVCNSEDSQVDEVVQELSKLGNGNYFRFNADRVHLDYELTVYPNTLDFQLTDLQTGETAKATDFSSVWYTEPDVADQRHGGIDEDIFDYVASEYRAAVEALLACFEMRGTTLVSAPSIIQAVGNKQKQQMIAQKVGFQLPQQLITTQNKAFTQEPWSSFAILKPVDSHKQFEQSEEGDTGTPYTQFVHEDLHAAILSEDVNLDVHYFQERLQQLAEYRIICFGTHAYAFKITGDYEVDWRRDLSVIHFDYIEDLEQNSLCIQYLKETGLNFGSFDLMETKDGLFFIECNSPGYFLFCDKSEEVELAHKFAAYLLE